jgi:hypothetical protein
MYISSGTMITGASDDLIEISGELEEEFNSFDVSDGTIVLSDGTFLNVEYDKYGTWRFDVIFKGSLFDFKKDGDVDKQTNDEVYFKSGLKWIVFTDDAQIELKRES